MEKLQKILLVDSNPSDLGMTEFYLTQSLYEVKTLANPANLSAEIRNWHPDLILMEAVFPEKEKFQLLTELRKLTNIPVILLSSCGEPADRAQGLELGADDYLAKPCDKRELLARIHAVLRRCLAREDKNAASREQEDSDFLRYPDLMISLTNYTVIYKNRSIELPPRELELLYFLAASPNQVFTREQLLDRLWGYDYMGDTRTVDVHIKRLREKFKPNEHWSIRTVWGVGYKFEVQEG